MQGIAGRCLWENQMQEESFIAIVELIETTIVQRALSDSERTA